VDTRAAAAAADNPDRLAARLTNCIRTSPVIGYGGCVAPAIERRYVRRGAGS
jgi:hypothetical protein